MKKFIWALALCLSSVSFAHADLIISAVVDGTQSGGNPKAMKNEATSAIADLSDFWIIRDTNGSAGGTFTQSDEFQLPSLSLAVGDFFVIYGNAASEAFNASLGNITPGVVNGILNHNGDDILAISRSDSVADVIDVYGLLGQGDTNFAQDSISVRSDPAPNATGVLDAGNFTTSTYTDEAFEDAFTVVAVPEPTTAVLFGLAGLGLCVVRRR